MHIHDVIDTDSHFRIDPVSRAITTKSDKLYVVQYDHDSSRFTFQIPRYVEEHDMSLCDRIEIHYTNTIRTKKEQNSDVYIVRNEDRTLDYDTVFFSWLISSNATQLVGYLKFSITFLCHDEMGNVTYEWGTTVYENVQVLAKNRNTEAVKEKYPDLYNQLKQDILNSIPPTGGEVDVEEVEKIILEYFETNPPLPGEPGAPGDPGYSPTVDVNPIENGYNITITDVNGSNTMTILNGKDGDDGYSPTIDVMDIEGGHLITITDINGTKTFTVLNGKDTHVTPESVKSAVEEYLAENPVTETENIVEF